MASGSRSIYKGSDETYLHECDVCKYNNKTSEAISFCTVCTEYLCIACDQSHQGSKATRDHKIVTGSRMPPSFIGRKPVSSIMYCEHHKTMTLNVYCVSHDVVICGTCKLTDHRKCKTTDVKQHKTTIKMRKAFVEMMRSMTGLKKKYENLTVSRQRDKRRLELELKNCHQDIGKMRKIINDKLDLLEKTIMKEASEIGERKTKEIEDHVTIADDALNQISGLITSLEDCQTSQDEDIMFVGMKKADILKNKYKAALFTLEEEICPIEISFKPNQIISDLMLHLQFLGTIQSKKRPSVGIMHHHSLLNISVGERRDLDVGCRYVWDCAFIGDSHLLLACDYDGLKLLDKYFKVQSQLLVPSFSVATINENEVIVTQSNMYQLQRVSIFPNMVVTKTLKMDRRCVGVDVFNNEIYVTCHNGPGNGEVRVLNMDGTLQRQLGVSYGQYKFSGPNRIKVSRDGSKLYVSDWQTDKVTCLSMSGQTLYEYSDNKFKGPSGLYIDDEDNAIVCGGDPPIVQVLDCDGKVQKVLLSAKDILKNPQCILYKSLSAEGRLVVGFHNVDKPLLIFSIRN